MMKYIKSGLLMNFISLLLSVSLQDPISAYTKSYLPVFQNQNVDFLNPEKISRLRDKFLKWRFTNRTNKKIYLKFYSLDRTSWVWPSPEKSYYLYPGQTFVYTISGLGGEKVCYGAWSQNFIYYWGTGLNARYACQNCCGYIGNSQMNTNLDF